MTAAAVLAAMPSAVSASEPRLIPLSRQLGNLHHPVSTTNELAQRFFNQGLTYIFGFNHDAAIRSFKRALAHDSRLAMAWWGIGFSLGPNINQPVSPEAEKAAYEAAATARSLIGAATTEPERDYIAALSKRYSIEPGADLVKLDREFRDAMKELMRKYPDDLDAAVLYAESMMNLKPWQLWSKEGVPADVTLEVVEVLESVLRRDPNHPGANHYYIHAVEASPYPERALPSAARLESIAPAAGHLVHMPAHIYMRTGDYAAAARRNEIASEVDFDYIQACGVGGFYPALYTSHNLHFAAVAHLFQGRYAAARRYSERLRDHVKPLVEQIPDLEPFLPTLEQVLVGFGRWQDILALPAPSEKHKFHTAFWRYARGMAQANLGQLTEAEQERSSLAALKAGWPEDAKFGSFNKAHDVFGIALGQLDARIALARGQHAAAEKALQAVLPIEENLRYMEPPDWYLFTREALGGTLLSAGKAAAAEEVFRTDLSQNHRKGRALYGLHQSLERQGKNAPARFIRRGFEAAWANADTELSPADIWVVQSSGTTVR